MMTPRKRQLSIALSAALAVHAGGAAAVHISPHGTGQVLLFPYYTARGGYNTLITVLNTQDNTKIVKVRFLEGKNSREVMDFNLFLAPNDVWTGAVVPTGGGARIVTNDNSCVTPSDLFAETRTDGLNPLNEFKNYQYTGSFADAAAFASLDRTREGYFEVIEMGVIDDDAIEGNPIAAGTTATTVTGYIKQNSAGLPANCGALDAFDSFFGSSSATRFPNTNVIPANNLTQAPRGGLAGRVSIINASNGANYTLTPTALDAWSNIAAYDASGNLGPSLGAASPAVSMVQTPAGTVLANWANGRDAVSAALMRSAAINEFLLDSGTASQTDWVVTFPTKRLYVAAGAGPALPPFANNFPSTALGSCDPVSRVIANRESLIPTAPGGGFPTLPPSTPVQHFFCWSANVVPFGGSSLLASVNLDPLTSSTQSFVNGAFSQPGPATTPALRNQQGPNGILAFRFDDARQALTPLSSTLLSVGNTSTAAALPHYGLPVIGVMLHNYCNTGVASRYGGAIEHKYANRID